MSDEPENDDKIRKIDPPVTLPDGKVIKAIDFSGFHPLDHSVWICRGYPGGRKTHLKYHWQFRWQQEVWRWTWCLIGRHHWTTVSRGPGDPQFHATSVAQQWEMCLGCGKRKD